LGWYEKGAARKDVMLLGTKDLVAEIKFQHKD
jgi:hypothetical protein